jgi:hypothetical protein
MRSYNKRINKILKVWRLRNTNHILPITVVQGDYRNGRVEASSSVIKMRPITLPLEFVEMKMPRYAASLDEGW